MAPASDSSLFRRLAQTVGAVETYSAPALGRASFRLYADAVGDPNPVYTDDRFAHAQGLPGVTAPPTLLCDTFRFFGPEITEGGVPRALTPQGAGPPLRAGNEYHFFRPLYPNDAVTLKRTILDVWRKQGRSGWLVFQRVENSYHDGAGEPLARNIETLCYRDTAEPSAGGGGPR